MAHCGEKVSLKAKSRVEDGSLKTLAAISKYLNKK
jgi:hypothetical protein